MEGERGDTDRRIKEEKEREEKLLELNNKSG